MNISKLAKTKSLLLLTALAIGAVSCTPVKRGEYAAGSATIFCDDGFKNILDEEIEVFEYTYPESSIIPFYVSEGEASTLSFLTDTSNHYNATAHKGTN